MLNPVVSALERAVRSRGSDPLVTWYGAGARVEFSVRTFANWVDKTANLIDALGATGSTISGQVSRTAPGNWMSLVWPLAAWQRGCEYSLVEAPADVFVLGPDAVAAQQDAPQQDAPKLACSLHPLGLGLRDLPAGVLDYTTEALSQPDAHWVSQTPAEAIAWRDAERGLSVADLAGLPATQARSLVRTGDAFTTLAKAVIAPLLGRGSCVLVDEPADEERLARLCRSERAVLA